MKNHQELINEINRFEKELSAKYSCGITLNFSINKYSLEHIKNVTNRVYKNAYETAMGIEDQTRNKFNVLFRAIYYKLGNEYGHTMESIAQYLGYNHATAFNGIKRVNLLLDKNDFHATKYFNKVKKELEETKI